jgi:hypothetical protein
MEEETEEEQYYVVDRISILDEITQKEKKRKTSETHVAG